ncbi:KAP family NTPase [Mesorhizobium sp. RMAD-H1]|uniref:KAP family NTPase n=1 Tax=Mesorhizobium sp. RMAD-H1 TaxID=2587065 RepID=UPI0016137ABF|nr:KAP family NTPase [Mesorhizobium sp. RMAD-H1]MBB2971274.1 hypothetical protein [Mesorhizobium sp. RMAD-H1]
MTEFRHISHQDRPIEAEAADQLDRGPFINSLIRALVLDELNEKGCIVGRHSTGYVVGLTGRWGLGKSSVLNLLAQKLDSMDHVIVATFNPWLFSGRDELLTGFFNSLRSAMGRSRVEEARALVKAIDRYWGAINVAGHGVATAIDLHGGSGAATAGWKIWGEHMRGAILKPKTRTPDEERFALEEKISQTNCSVVVLIDELDRVEDNEVRAVAQLVKAVGDIKGVSYLVAYDPDRVVQALGRGEGNERRESGERYLEKIIQHPIPLRPLFAEDIRRLLRATLADNNVTLETPGKDSQQLLFNHFVDVIQTPREIKRLIGAFSVLGRTVRGEICPYDVLAYCWVLTKSPTLRDQIAAHFDNLVSDPSERVMSERVIRNLNKEAEPGIAELLGEAAIIHTKTLELLFPRLRGQAVDSDDGERLSRRRNLVRMLYLGDPPGTVRRSDLESLWNNSNVTELEIVLRQLMNEGKLASVIDRLDDLVHLLPESGDQIFWVALGRTFFRHSDWLSAPEATRALAEDAATTLFRIGQRDRSQAHRLRATIETLIAKGDLVLVPWILRKHLFAHGLTKYSSAPRGGEVLTRQETENLLARELPRYIQAVRDGTALRRLPNMEAVYVILNTENWDKELHSSLTAQLDTLEAISTLAALLLPPGTSAERSLLDELFDADSVQKIIETLIADAGVPANPWLADNLERLRALLVSD